MLKKILGATVIFFSAMLISISAFAANTVSITSATYGSDTKVLADTEAAAPEITRNDLVTIKASISAPGSEVTVLVVDASLAPSGITDDKICFIDQVTSDSTGKAQLSFRMPLNAAQGTYAVYVGGTDSATVVKYFKLPEATNTYISGDVDGSGTVTNSDAVYILRYGIGLPLPSTVTIGQEMSM